MFAMAGLSMLLGCGAKRAKIVNRIKPAIVIATL